MKNIKNLLAAVCALVSAASMAVVFQPGTPVSEDAPMRVSAGLGTSFVNNAKGFGINNVGLGLGFAHNLGYDFEYGIAVGGDWATPAPFRIFTDDAKDAAGVRVDLDLLMRFMPEIAENFRLGARLNAGFGTQFGGEALKPLREAVSFGDLNFRVGPAMNWGCSDMFSLYLSPALSFNNVRFLSDKGDAVSQAAMKASANLVGMEAVLGAHIGGENVGFYIETTTKLAKFKDFSKNDYKQDLLVGVSFAM